jgi:hypothetical protein
MPEPRDVLIDAIEQVMPAETVNTREYGQVGIAPEVGDIADAVLAAGFAVEAEVIARQAMLKGLTVEEGAAVLELDAPREIMLAWVWAAREMLGDAPNYVETTVDEVPREGSGVSMTVKAAGEAQRYIFTLQRAGNITPHEARRQAEQERDAMRGRAENLLAGWKDNPDGTIARVCRHILGLPEPTDD